MSIAYQHPLRTPAEMQARVSAETLVPRQLYVVQDDDAYYIVQALTTSTYAIVGRGGDIDVPIYSIPADIRSGTGRDYLSPEFTWAALAPVALTDAETIALNLGSGIGSFTVTITVNRTLGNPTNPKPGQKFNITVTRSAAQTLSFGSNYVPMGPMDLPASGKRFKVVGEVITSTEIHIMIVGEP
ncbi:hypothetical protein ACUSIJ_29560 [Pseudochelatococcus sp. B33]